MIGNLYFDDKFDNKILIAENIKISDICQKITSILKELRPDHVICYFRTWIDGRTMTYDFGSHSEFFRFIIKEDD